MAATNNEHDIRDDLLCIGEKVIDIQLPCIKMYFYYINLFLLLTCGKTRIVCMGFCQSSKATFATCTLPEVRALEQIHVANELVDNLDI